jgi:hypothetical protein
LLGKKLVQPMVDRLQLFLAAAVAGAEALGGVLDHRQAVAPAQSH